MCQKDGIPMSPAVDADHVGIHFTWYKKHDELVAVLPAIEKALVPFRARPHVGKLFVLNGNRFEELYGKELMDFRALVLKMDPEGKFGSEFTDEYIFNNSKGTPYAKL